jgi:hypothetical protein
MSVFLSLMENNCNNYSAMVSWLKDTCSKLPKEYGNILLFCTLSGLRPDEACQSINLIQTDLANYLKKELMTLEHYKYLDNFIRKAKKSYITVIDKHRIELARSCKNCGYNALRLLIVSKVESMRMKDCRSIFATYLRMNGVRNNNPHLVKCQR